MSLTYVRKISNYMRFKAYFSILMITLLYQSQTKVCASQITSQDEEMVELYFHNIYVESPKEKDKINLIRDVTIKVDGSKPLRAAILEAIHQLDIRLVHPQKLNQTIQYFTQSVLYQDTNYKETLKILTPIDIEIFIGTMCLEENIYKGDQNVWHKTPRELNLMHRILRAQTSKLFVKFSQ